MQQYFLNYQLEQYVNPNPTMVIGGVSIVTQDLPMGLGQGRVMQIEPGSGFGFESVEISKKWFMKVDPFIDYEISFWFKQDVVTPCLFLRVHAFDCGDNELDTYNITNGAVENTFVGYDQVIVEAENWYFARYILYGANENIQFGLQPYTSLSVGKNLKMNKKTSQILVDLATFLTDEFNTKILMYNFKVKPLRTPFSRGHVQGSDLLVNWRKNNSEKFTEKQVDDLATDFLFPYNTANKSINLIKQ